MCLAYACTHALTVFVSVSSEATITSFGTRWRRTTEQPVHWPCWVDKKNTLPNYYSLLAPLKSNHVERCQTHADAHHETVWHVVDQFNESVVSQTRADAKEYPFSDALVLRHTVIGINVTFYFDRSPILKITTLFCGRYRVKRDFCEIHVCQSSQTSIQTKFNYKLKFKRKYAT